jgi:predicted metal-dependent hydrolase
LAERVELPAGLVRFTARFDQGEFWLAHEELEELWLDDRRDLFKGLIHLAAACLHLQRGNRNGALTKLDSAARLIAGDEGGLPGFDAAGLLAAATALTEAARANQPGTVPRLADYFDLPDTPTSEAAQLPYRVRRYEHGYRTGRDPHRRD